MIRQPAVLRDDATLDPFVRSILVATAWVLIAFGFLLAGIFATETPLQGLRVAMNAAVGVVGMTALFLLHIGRQRAGAHLCVWAIWSIVTLLVWRNGGINAPNLMTYPVLVVLSGWLLGTSSTMCLAGMTATAMILFHLASDSLPVRETPENQLVLLMYILVILFLTTSLTLLSRRNYMQRLDEITRQAGELARRDVELKKLSLAVEQSPESILITDPEGRIEYVNDAFVAHSGFSREEALGQTPRILRSGKTPRATYDALEAAMARGEAWRGEFVNRRKDGSEVIESASIAPIRQADGSVSHYVAVEQDLTVIREALSEIDRLANFDPLTGLPNRSLLIERLGQVLALRQGGQHSGALAILDIDRFKNVNDGRGHAAGDALLVALARRLAGAVREGDTVARLGADEFALMLRDAGHRRETAGHLTMAAIARIEEALRQPVRLDDGDEIVARASLGVTLFPEGVQDGVADVIRRADTALHRAKAAGGGRVEFFDRQMSSAAELRFKLERDLRRAIPGGELRLFLQPQVDASGRRVGAEVLVRWQHPELGLVPPGTFIPVAEESDLIVDLDTWVMTEACRLVARQAGNGAPLDVSINVSPRHFLQAGFVKWLTGMLASTGAQPQRITLELTESLVLADIDEAVARMAALAALGIRFSIDDFGTGYSSLAYLKRLPIHELKIDRTFVHDAPRDAGSAALVETILAVARVMGLTVVAEGVETHEQAAFLNARGEVLHQGYLFGRPAEASEWIDRWGQAGPQA